VQAQEGLNYYRLRQTDFDGKFSYSSVIALRSVKRDDVFVLYPNPSQGNFTITMNDLFQENYELRMINSLGEVVYTQRGISESVVPVNANLANGIYTLSLIFEGNIFTQKVIVR
jgi:hypothetical protein